MPNLHLLSDSATPAPRFAFAGGGTGGHLIPAIALAKELERSVPGASVEFIIPGKALERSILDDHGMSYRECGGVSPSGSLLRKAKSALSLVRAYGRCKRILREMQPDAVIGVGGYGSVCGGMAAKKLRLPLYLLEQNTMPGRVNRLMSKRAQALYAQWPLVRGVGCPVHVLGNPIRRTLARFSRPDAIKRLGLRPELRTLLVMGGSQGAQAINNALFENMEMLEARADQLQVIHLTGERSFNDAQREWAWRGVNSLVMPYATDMAAIIAASDLVLCRSGATTISELNALGKPMILVPLPSAAEDHQRLNAEYVANQDAAELIEQSDLRDPSTFEYVLDGVLLNDARRASLALHSMAMGEPKAASAIARHLLDGIGLQVVPQVAESSQRLATIEIETSDESTSRRAA